MISDWKALYSSTIKTQPGYTNNLKSVGESYKGIIRKVWKTWGGWQVIDQYKTKVQNNEVKVNSLATQDKTLKQLVEAFYREKFWDKIHGDSLPSKLAAKLFDTAIDVTAPISIFLLQKALNAVVMETRKTKEGELFKYITEDGIYTKETDLAIKEVFKKYEVEEGQKILIKWYCKYQVERYYAITTRYPKQRTFLKGRLEKALYQGD